MSAKRVNLETPAPTSADVAGADLAGAPDELAPVGRLETRIVAIGEALARRVNNLVAAIPGNPQGPVPLARAIGVNKVLTSRLLRAAASRDPVAVLQMMPGPDPLRKLAQAAGKKGVPRRLVAEVEQAAEAFDDLIRTEAGDRSGLDAILSAWLPESRGEFELRRKQAAFRALSQLHGHMAETYLSTVFMHPSADGRNLDIVWVIGLLGLQRLRPGGRVKFATRRVPPSTGPDGEPPRRPQTLDGEPVEGFDGLRLDAFSSKPPAPLEVHRVGEVVHYTLADHGFGPRSATDLVFAEVNRAELPRFVAPDKAGRKRHVFVEVNTPSKVLIFDALMHADAYGRPGAAPPDPSLLIYDTSFEGIANVNDRARDIDRMELAEAVQPLGVGVAKFRAAEIPWYSGLLRTVCAKLGWNPDSFRGYRTRIDYPIYGSQVVLAWDAPVAPTGSTSAR